MAYLGWLDLTAADRDKARPALDLFSEERTVDEPGLGSLRDAQKHGVKRGLNTEDVAYHDSLAENESAREAMQSDTLRLMTRELAEVVKNAPKLDWRQRESADADLRRTVHRLLAKYGYPPKLAEEATQLVLRQTEFSTENAPVAS